jgi:predicted O-methyltransferase YrrM
VVIDDAFLAEARKLYVPEMGTESTAPLLYWLVRTLRPQRVLEVGMGYTSVFLARALADNVADFERERRHLDDLEFLTTNPMIHRGYYDKPYEPQLLCIDRMTDTASSAPRALQSLEALGLQGVCEVLQIDLRDSRPTVRERFPLIDLAWVDTWDTLAFVREYWDLISPAGGVLAVHYLMTYPEGRAVQHFLRSLRGPEDGKLEMINLLEPHKSGQNSLTLLRRTRDYVEPRDLRPQGSSNDPRDVLGLRASGTA